MSHPKQKDTTRVFSEIIASRWLRTSRIVAFFRLDTLGSASSLLCGEMRRQNNTQLFWLSIQIRTDIFRFAKNRLYVVTPKQKDTTRVSRVMISLFGGGDFALVV